MSFPPFQVAKHLKDLGINVDHVLIASMDSSLNPVYKVDTPDQQYAIKIYQDHPYGYYTYSRKQIERMIKIVEYLSEKMNYIPVPFQTHFDFTLGPMIRWPWLPEFENTLNDDTYKDVDQ